MKTGFYFPILVHNLVEPFVGKMHDDNYVKFILTYMVLLTI